jgi:fructose-1,6-bisphosphatase/inositol monophosphatase family enzyme
MTRFFEVDPASIQATLREAADAVRNALSTFEGQGLSGKRPTQYELDLVADESACSVLLEAGFAVFSEESGARGSGELVAVIDPVDGSTNADRGIPFYCVSICVLDEQGPLAGLVESLPTNSRYEAVRGQGATRDGQSISTSGATEEAGSVVGVNGVLTEPPPWAQSRTMGAAALEMCLVADGALDGYVQAGGAAIHPWDYLAAMLIVQEAGGTVLEADGSDLVLVEALPRRPVVGATKALAQRLLSNSSVRARPIA